MQDSPVNPSELLELTADIVASHVSNNSVAVADLGSLIEQVYTTLARVSQQDNAAEAARPEPAVPIKKSITPDFII